MSRGGGPLRAGGGGGGYGRTDGWKKKKKLINECININNDHADADNNNDSLPRGPQIPLKYLFCIGFQPPGPPIPLKKAWFA